MRAAADSVAAGPVGFLVVLALVAACVLLFRSMNRRITRLPGRFGEPPVGGGAAGYREADRLPPVPAGPAATRPAPDQSQEDPRMALDDDDMTTTPTDGGAGGGDADQGDSDSTQVDPSGSDPAGVDGTGGAGGDAGGDADQGDSDDVQVDPSGSDPAGSDPTAS